MTMNIYNLAERQAEMRQRMKAPNRFSSMASPILSEHISTDHVQQWLEHLTVERGRAPLTVKTYERSLTAFRRWLRRPLLTASREDIQRYMVAELRRVSGRTADRRLCALRSFYRFLHAEDICPCNPTRGLKTPRHGHRLPDWLNPKQMRRLLQTAEKADSVFAIRDALVLHFLYGSGLRANEVSAICRDDLARDFSSVRVHGKGRIERLTPLSNQTRDLLQPYLASPEAPEGKYLFPRFYDTGSVHGQRGDMPISRHRVWQIVNTAAKAAGISAHPHTLRHSAAAAMTCNGAGISDVQAFLGHSSPETTMIYSHLNLATMRRAFKRHHPRA